MRRSSLCFVFLLDPLLGEKKKKKILNVAFWHSPSLVAKVSSAD
jgi:hypothetical protein